MVNLHYVIIYYLFIQILYFFCKTLEEDVIESTLFLIHFQNSNLNKHDISITIQGMWECYIYVIFSFTLYPAPCSLHPGNLELRHSVFIKTVIFSGFRRILDASRYQSEEIDNIQYFITPKRMSHNQYPQRSCFELKVSTTVP